MTVNQLEWLGAAFALLGSFLLATHGSWADIGFYSFFISNVFLMAFAIRKKLFGILVMQFGFTGTSILGIVNSQF